jgi:hypothetical protein
MNGWTAAAGGRLVDVRVLVTPVTDGTVVAIMARITNRSGLTVAVLEQMLQKRRSELDSLTKERQRIAKQLADVDARLRAISGGTSGGAALTRSGRVRNPVSLVGTMEQVLTKAGKPLSVGDIVQGVLDTGYQSGSANFRAIVNQTLIKERKRFANTQRAVYELK